jgi:hypothetical protein
MQQVQGTARQHGSHIGEAAGSRSTSSRPSGHAGSLTSRRRTATEQQQSASIPALQSIHPSRKGAGTTAAGVAEGSNSKQVQPGAKHGQPAPAGDDVTAQKQRSYSRSSSHGRGAGSATGTASPAGGSFCSCHAASCGNAIVL